MDSIRDPSFQKFLDNLQKQNNKQFATQLLQLKSEREIAGEDNDKREEQLDAVKEELTNIKVSITGFDVKPLVDAATNQTQLLTKSLEELSLLRKINEGSLEYDKDSAQYRNTSGREITSDVSGKTIKKGGYIDFETAANRLAGQGKRVQEANKIDIKPVSFVPGKMTASNFASPPREVKETKEVVNKTFLEEISSGIKYFLTDGLSEKKGYGLFQKPPEEEVKEREQKISSDRQKIESTVNPESDNIVTATEAQSDYAKEDLELSKQLLNTTKEQLQTLKEIKDALAPKVPAELPDQSAVKKGLVEEKEADSGPSLLDAGLGLGKKALGALGAGARAVGRGAAAAGRGALSLGGAAAKFAGSGAGKALGAAAAIGVGAYTAYQGYNAAEDSKQAKLENVQTRLDAGEITPEQAAIERKEIGNTATVEKSTAVGEGTGMAGGAVAGGLAGAKLGATIGTFVGGPVGTAIGAGIGTLAGGAIGAFGGTELGKVAGEKVGQGINYVKENAANIGSAISTKASDIGSAISTKASDIGSTISTKASDIGSAISTKASDIGSAISTKASSLGEGISSWFSNKKKEASGIVNNKIEDVKNVSNSLSNVYNDVSKTASNITNKIAPASPAFKGAGLLTESTENVNLNREAGKSTSVSAPIISNSVNNTQTTKFVPIKATPRGEGGSSLDRYLSRITAY